MLAVASSKITTFDDLRMALHIQINYLSPEDKFDPFSESYISNPLSYRYNKSSS